MDATGNDLSENETSKKSELKAPGYVAPTLLTVVLFLVAALTITIALSLLWELPFGSGTLQIVVCMFNGMLLSLPVLISLWTVLGGQKWIIRIPLATLCLVALVGVFFATVAGQAPSLPPDVFWLFGGVALAVSVSVQIPLWILRAWNGISITRKRSGSETEKQFTIKQLLITTTIFACLAPLLQWFATFGAFTNDLPVTINTTVGFCGVFIVVLAFLTLLSVLGVFSPKLRVVSVCVLAVGIGAIPFAVVPSINYVLARPCTNTDLLHMGINVFVFSISNAMTMIVVMSMYYSLGFRLRNQQG